MLLNLTVVYFALGAPLGVYGVIRSKGTSPRAFGLTLMRFLFWPLFAAASMREAFVFQSPDDSVEQKLEALRVEFEAGIDRRSLFEFREVFARYTGLALAAANAAKGAQAGELLKIAGRRKSAAASACLARRNRRRLELHLRQARNEFNDLTTRNATIRTRDLTERLTEVLSND